MKAAEYSSRVLPTAFPKLVTSDLRYLIYLHSFFCPSHNFLLLSHCFSCPSLSDFTSCHNSLISASSWLNFSFCSLSCLSILSRLI